jgi:hypothetical protein
MGVRRVSELKMMISSDAFGSRDVSVRPAACEREDIESPANDEPIRSTGRGAGGNPPGRDPSVDDRVGVGGASLFKIWITAQTTRITRKIETTDMWSPHTS